MENFGGFIWIRIEMKRSFQKGQIKDFWICEDNADTMDNRDFISL